MSIRVNTNLNLKERKVYTFEDFRGVDFSNSPYKVLKNRAISAENLIYENGTVRKRTGWQSVCKLDGAVNGIFSFDIDDTNFIIAYAGTKFYRLQWDTNKQRAIATDITNTCTYSNAVIDPSKLVSRRIQLYVNKNKAYIVGCGDYLVFGSWNNGTSYELRRVYDNEDTYIPTTTINIDNDNVNDENRASLDGVNLLSSKRVNELVGVDAASGTWTLDAPIDNNSDISIKVYTIADGENTTIEINNRITDDKSLLYIAGDDINSVGSLDLSSGKITLNINTKPQEDDTSNIIVTFKSSTEDQDSLISNGTLSIVFGGGGNSNRLFIGGNSIRKNVHVWSEMYDFTYFIDTNFDEIGGDSSAIVGYVRATDGILLVFKEKNGSDATIYYVSGTDTQEVDSNNNPVFMTKFTKYTGNVSDTIYGKYATASLNGDNLILTRNGVKGLEMFDNVTTNAYRVRERSRNINAKLLKQSNLQDACATVYKDKYYLSVDGVAYVCDSRFTFQVDEDISDSFNYEWWYFTDVDARVWSEIDGILYFGTNTGLICRFVDENFADITYQDTEEGDLSISYTDNVVSYNMELEEELGESDNITFVQGDVFALYLGQEEMLEVDEDGWITIEEETLSKVYGDIEFYADDVADTGLNINTKYHIGEVDLANLKFRIYDANNEVVIPSALGFSLCKYISNKKLFLAEINAEQNEFKLKEFIGGETLDIVAYNGIIPSNLLATIQFNKNVKASWYTPIYDLGSNMFSKTLLGITITTEPLIKGAISVGYQTRNIEKDFLTYGTKGFDFNDIDFEEFSFESSFTNSNTLRVKERNFNFILLRYTSDNQKACAVNGITIRYKINRLNKGVR